MNEELYPEHVKLAKVADESQVLGEFLDEFLPNRSIYLMEYSDDDGLPYPTFKSTSWFLYEFFGIDPKKLEQEKRALLEAHRS